MKLLKSGWVLAILAALLSIGTTGGLIYLQRETIFTPPSEAGAKDGKPYFWSFRAEDVDAFVAELKQERTKLVERQAELDKVAAHVEAEKAELEKTREDVGAMRDALSVEIPEIQESERKNLKTLAQTYSSMSPDAAVAILEQMDDTMCVKILSLMKPDKVGGILEGMSAGASAKRAALISEKLRLVKLPAPTPQP
jgi:flagellar motility protein MotE (MotC chaperone)